MSENNQKRKIIVSEKTFEKISEALKDAISMEGFEIEVIPNDKFKERIRKANKNDFVFKDEETETMVLEFKMPPEIGYSEKFFPLKKQKMYVPKTIGKPINKKKGGR
ncbi:MAG: hypothetical protein IJ019_05385 [Alphaproteobacteria bacterium]|nr:hypothetical protein [Alphaproteobacteria bacterium]